MRICEKLGRIFLPTAWASSNFRNSRPVALPLLCAVVATLLTSSPSFAQPAAPPVVTSPSACATDAHRAFDFWIGVWDVTAAGQDQPSAVNRISREHGGCALREDYATKGGYTGMSISFYEASRGKWHQTWMGADGTALYIEGGLNDQGEMVLSSRNTPYHRKAMPINRLTWTPRPDGSVRQHWQASSDAGASWSTVFDGLYIRQAP